MSMDLFIGTRCKPLKEARPGLCVSAEKGTIIFKTEYSKEINGEYVPECYNEAGECYCGSYDILVYSANIEGGF